MIRSLIKTSEFKSPLKIAVGSANQVIQFLNYAKIANQK
jgi:hypothetical protein